MKKTFGTFLFLLVAPIVIFLILHVVYSPPLKHTALYLTVSIIGATFVFFGEYGKILLVTLYALLISQPFVARFFYYEFHTLQPNFTASVKIDSGMLRGLDSQITITTDSNGFRTNTPEAYKKQFKIFMVGGSTTEQIFIDDRKTTSALLEREIGNPNYSVINTGLSGLRALHHIATINAIKKFEPYLIVVLLGINDWDCALREPCKRLSTTLQFNPRDWPITLAAASFVNLLRPSKNNLDFDPNQDSKLMGHYEEKRKIELTNNKIDLYVKSFQDDFTELLRTCESIKTTCIIVTQPTSYKHENFENPKFVQSLWMTPPDKDWALTENSLISIATAFNDYIRNNTKCANCLLFDLEKLMDGKRNFFYDDAHFNNEGAKFFAQELLGFLRTRELLR